MLQVISGKFFKTTKDENIHITPYSFLVYSNVLINETINNNIFSIEPIYKYRAINTYLVKFENKIEKQKGQAFQINSIGQNQIIDDIMACMSIFFMGVFTTDKDYLYSLIMDTDDKTYIKKLPKELVPYIFDKNKFEPISEEKVKKFNEFINKTISLNRNDYKKIIEVIRQFYKVVLLVNVNVDLAYSTLVAGIETLATEYDGYETKWEDIDKKLSKDIEEVLLNIKEEDANSIKQAIIDNHHAKLTQRYIKYCKHIVQDDYFMEEYMIDKKASAKKMDLFEAIELSYNSRSKYVHTFEKIGEEITIFSKREICYIKGMPYITLNGLVRLYRYITIKTMNSLETIELEQINYFEELPGSIALTLDNMDPSIWLNNEDSYTLDTSIKYLNGLISHICSVWMGYEQNFIDLKNICNKIEKLLKGLNGNSENKGNLITFYMIYNELLNFYGKEYTSKNYEQIMRNNAEVINKIDIKVLTYYLLFKDDNPVNIEEIKDIYSKYKKDKYKKNKLELPTIVQNLILIEILNDCVNRNNKDEYEECLSELIGENPGSEYLINIFKSYYNKNNLEKILETYEIYDSSYSKKKWIANLINIAKYNNDVEKYEKYINELIRLNPRNEHLIRLSKDFDETKHMKLIENVHMHIV